MVSSTKQSICTSSSLFDVFLYIYGHIFQPAKSVALNIKAKSKKKSLNVKNYKLGAKTKPTVESAVHLGINRTTLLTENMTINVEENIKKARRSAYGLICFIIRFWNSSSCASGVAFGIINPIPYINKTGVMYVLSNNMLEAWWYLDNAPKKAIWTTAVKRKIHEHWSKPIVESTPYYNSLQYLSCVNLEKGKLHPIITYC
jgi:hypothetical protein